MARIDRVSYIGVQEDRHWEHCVLLIPAPADTTIYACCKAIAQHLNCDLACARLWLEHEVPLSPGLCDAEPPVAIARVLEHDASLIARIRLEAAGLKIEYVRSGGHDPFRQSFFDEVLLDVTGELQLDEQQLQEILMILFTDLDAAAVRGSKLFTSLLEAGLRSSPPHLTDRPPDRAQH